MPPSRDLSDAAIAARLDEIATACSGKIGFYARDLVTGRIIERDADGIYPTASLIKVAILYELERQALESTVAMDQSLALREEDKVGGSSLLRRMSAGITLPLRDWAYLMMQVSDNTATNVLIDLAGKERINQSMEAAGFPAIRLNNKIDFERLWQDPNDLGVGSPRAFAELLALISADRLLTEEACKDMRRLMEGVGAAERLARYIQYNPYAEQQRERGIPPQETGPMVRFFGKTGSLAGIRTHAGVLWSDEASYRIAMCAMVCGSTDRSWTVENDALVAIGRCGRLAYDAFAA